MAHRSRPKILIVRLSSIGDMVLTTPIIRRLHAQLDAEIHYLTKARFRGVLEHHPAIHRLWTFERNLDEVLPQLKAEGFSEVIDLHKNLRTRKLKSVLKVSAHSFPKLNLQKWIYVNFGWDLMPDVHIVDRYMRAVEHLGVLDDGQGLDYFPGERAEKVRSKLPEEPYVAVVIGGNHPGKRLAAHQLKQLCSQISHPVVLLGGPEDAQVADEVAGRDHVLNFVGKISLNESAIAVRESAAVIAHDTGLMHVAAAYGKDVLSIWGATVPEFGMYPYRAGEKSQMFRPFNRKHRPHSKLGNKHLLKGRFKGMSAIRIDDIARVANEILLLS